MKAKGSADYVDAARTAEAEQALVAKAGDGRAVVLLPLDWVSWTEAVAEAASEIVSRAKQELGAGAVEMQLTGRTSEQAGKELATLGFKVQQHVPAAGSGS